MGALMLQMGRTPQRTKITFSRDAMRELCWKESGTFRSGKRRNKLQTLFSIFAVHPFGEWKLQDQTI
jgi:hypothetical protein